MAHRIEPLTGSMRAHTKKRQRSHDDCQKQVYDDVRERSQDYAFMLHNLMRMIQDYLLLSDTDKQEPEENRICIWLEDVQEA